MFSIQTTEAQTLSFHDVPRPLGRFT